MVSKYITCGEALLRAKKQPRRLRDKKKSAVKLPRAKKTQKKAVTRQITCGEVEVLDAGFSKSLVKVWDAADDANGPEHGEGSNQQPISDAGHHVAAARRHL